MKRGLPRDERREMVGRRLRVQATKERARLEMGVYRGTRASSSRASDSDVNENRESLAPSSDFSPRRFRAARRAGGWLVSAPRPRQETESGQNGKRETAEAVPPEEEDGGAKQEREREEREISVAFIQDPADGIMATCNYVVTAKRIICKSETCTSDSCSLARLSNCPDEPRDCDLTRDCSMTKGNDVVFHYAPTDTLSKSEREERGG